MRGPLEIETGRTQVVAEQYVLRHLLAVLLLMRGYFPLGESYALGVRHHVYSLVDAFVPRFHFRVPTTNRKRLT